MKPFALAALAATLALSAAPAWAQETPKEAANKAAVLAFYDLALNQKDFDKASAYLGPRYTQHNPGAADGPEGLKGFLGYMKASFPNARSEVKHAYVDGDTVILHVHSTPQPGARGKALVDIFRLENGKIVEHWDVIQDIPETAKNTNGMF